MHWGGLDDPGGIALDCLDRTLVIVLDRWIVSSRIVSGSRWIDRMGIWMIHVGLPGIDAGLLWMPFGWRALSLSAPAPVRLPQPCAPRVPCNPDPFQHQDGFLNFFVVRSLFVVQSPSSQS